MSRSTCLKQGNRNVSCASVAFARMSRATRLHARLMAVPVLSERPICRASSTLTRGSKRSLVEPLSLAAAAAGADGIIVEVHPVPRRRSATARRRVL